MYDKVRKKSRREYLYLTKWRPAYEAFISHYPLSQESLACEIWKDIANYEGLYQNSNYGRVKSLPRRGTKGKILKPGMSKDGYLFINLFKDGKGKACTIHRLIAQAFVPNPLNLPEVNHKLGNKFDNCFENLEWCTESENQQHAFKTGLKKAVSRENHHSTKLTDKQRQEILNSYIYGSKEFGTGGLAKKYDVTPQSIWRILKQDN